MGPLGLGLQPLRSFLLSCFGLLSLINQAMFSYWILLNITSFTTLANTVKCWVLLHCYVWVVAEVGWFSAVSRISRFWIFYGSSARVPGGGNGGFHSVLNPDVFATLRRQCVLSDTAISCCLQEQRKSAPLSQLYCTMHCNVYILY